MFLSGYAEIISIHALREESDFDFDDSIVVDRDFNPRPP